MNMTKPIKAYLRKLVKVNGYDIEKLREKDEKLDEILSLYEILFSQGTGDPEKIVYRQFVKVFEYISEAYK